MKYCFILWTRPEIIKLFSCIKYAENSDIDYFVIHTNQHYSDNMDKVFFDELDLKKPKYNLWINGWTHWKMTWTMLIDIEEILLKENPDIVLVQWDTNTVLAWALTASKLWIRVWHIEAGLRSYDRAMPEEINRVVTDHISDFCFCPTDKQVRILKQESIDLDKIFQVWNTISDAVEIVKEWSKNKREEILNLHNIQKNEYILFTTHRPSNVDDKENLESLLDWINEIQEISWKKIVFPIHPRTKNNITKFWLNDKIKKFIVIDPVWFSSNIILQSCSYMVVTDSWWMQEESCILKRKTLILRHNTERPETLDVWGSVLVWNETKKIIEGFSALQDKEVDWYNPFWNGKTYQKIFQIVSQSL